MAREIRICEGKRGTIEIRFQLRKVRYVLAPVYDGRWNNPSERAKAQDVANLISLDMATGNFDASLVRYKPKIFAGKAPLNNPSHGESLDLLELWRLYTEFRKPSITTTTLNSDYADVKRLLTNLFADGIDEPDAIARWVISNKTTGSARRLILQLRACCNWAFEEELIKAHPFEKYHRQLKKKPDSEPTDIDPFSVEERDQIIKTFYEAQKLKPYAHFVDFLFNVGCRPSEAIALTWNDVAHGCIIFNKAYTQKGQLKKQTKRGRGRTVRQNEKVKQILDNLRKTQKEQVRSPKNLVFPSVKSRSYIEWANFSNNYWRFALSECDEIKYRNPYQMRHTFITIALRNSVSPQNVADSCGNSVNIIFKHYAAKDRSFVMPEF